MDTSVITNQIIIFLKELPLNMKLLIIAGFVLYTLYTIRKRKKELPSPPYKKAIGEEFHSNLQDFNKAIKKVKNADTKELLEDTYKVSQRIYRKIIKLSNDEIQNRIGTKLSESIVRFGQQQLKLVTQLVDNYVNIEKKVTYTDTGDKIFTDNNKYDAMGMDGIEQEFQILHTAFINLYNNIEIAVNKKRAKTLSVPAYNTGTEPQSETKEKIGADIQEIQQLILRLNTNIRQDSSFRKNR